MKRKVPVRITKEETLTGKWRDLQRKSTHKNLWYISTITDVILDQKRVNVCEHTVKMAPHGTIFTVCSHTFTLFWLRKTSVIIEIYKINLHVFVCAFPPEISSFFGDNFTLFWNRLKQLSQLIYYQNRRNKEWRLLYLLQVNSGEAETSGLVHV